jgi:hypothetical protein
VRFATKFDGRIVAALLGGGFASLVLPWVSLAGGGPLRHPAPDWLRMLPWVVWPAILVCMLPQYYEVRPDGLFIRQGWRKVLIKYADLAELQTTMNTRSGAVFSMDRITVATRTGRTLIIAPADQQGLLAAVALRCPHLERKGSGLGSLLSSPQTW